MGERFEEGILEIDCIDVEGKTDKTAKFYGKNFLNLAKPKYKQCNSSKSKLPAKLPAKLTARSKITCDKKTLRYQEASLGSSVLNRFQWKTTPSTRRGGQFFQVISVAR